MPHAKRKKRRRGPRRGNRLNLRLELPNPVAVAAVDGVLDVLEDEWRKAVPSSTSSQATAIRSVFGSMIGMFARDRRKNITIGEGEFAITVRPVDLEAAGRKAMHDFARVLTSDFVKRKIAEGADQAVDELLLDEDDDVTAGGNPIRACPDPDDD